MSTRDPALLKPKYCYQCGYDEPCTGFYHTGRGAKTVQIMRPSWKNIRCEAYKKPGTVAKWEKRRK